MGQWHRLEWGDVDKAREGEVVKEEEEEKASKLELKTLEAGGDRVWHQKGGWRRQWNPEDEVTNMPRVIRRLWLLDFEALLCDSPTSSLLFILLRGTINRTMSSTYDLAVGCVKKREEKEKEGQEEKEEEQDKEKLEGIVIHFLVWSLEVWKRIEKEDIMSDWQPDVILWGTQHLPAYAFHY